MPMIDPFTPDAFRLQTLTAAINHVPFQPTRIAQLGWFEAAGVSTLTVNVEERDGVLSLVSPKPRGGEAQPLAADGDRRLLPFIIPHLPQHEALLADEVQGVRAFGSESAAEALTIRLNEKLARMRTNLDYTLEYHRLQAVMGNYIDANGNATSLFTTFGVAQQTKQIGLHATNRSSIRAKMFDVQEYLRTALGGLPYRSIRVLCSSTFWAALIEDKDTRDTYLNQVQAAELRGDPSQSFTAFGATWEYYPGTSTANFGSDAYAVPDGVPGLFLTRFGPADYIETVNTIGLPYYAKAEAKPMGKGWDIEAQSNALNICTRPRAIIKLTV